MTEDLEQRIASLEKQLQRAQQAPQGHSGKARPSKRLSLVILGVIIGIGLLGAVGFVLAHHRTKPQTPNPIPLSVRDKVNFPVYYPVQAKLPAGYVLNTSSISASNEAAVYAVDYGNGQKIVFAVQQKPSATGIQGFYAAHMPLHSNINTPAGTAAIGAINQQTVVSLPTSSNAWLLITAPLNINQSQLKQVVQAIVAPN